MRIGPAPQRSHRLQRNRRIIANERLTRPVISRPLTVFADAKEARQEKVLWKLKEDKATAAHMLLLSCACGHSQ